MTRRFSRITLFFALTVLFAGEAIALDPNRVKSQYAYDSWGSDQGLAGEVHAITQSGDGYLWIGTERGLYRFDGISFRLIADQGPSPISLVQVMGLTVNAQGNPLIRLPERNLVRFADGKFENLLYPLSPRELAVTAMYRGRSGDILLTGLVLGLLRYAGGRFETIAPAGSLPPSPVTAITQSDDGKIWLGTRDAGLFDIDAGRAIAVRGELPSPEITSLLAVGTSVWVGTKAGLARWNGTAITNQGVPASLVHTNVRALLTDRQSNLWVGTVSGLIRVNGSGASPLDRPERGANASVSALFEDQEGNLWAGGPWGMERWRDGAFMTYGKPEGLPSDHNGPVYVDTQGRTWFAPLEGGLYWLSGGRPTQVVEAGLTTDVVYSITANNGDLWIGRQRGGLTRLRDQGGGFAAKTFTQAEGLAQNTVYSVYQSRDGAIWAGTLNGGVSRYQNGKFTTYSAADGLASNTVSSILESSNGTMWFATPKGLRALSHNRWQGYAAKEGLPSDEVNCMVEDSSGILWIGTAAGLAFLQAGRIEAPGTGPESLQHPVFGLAPDENGWLWIATSDHIIRVNRDKLLAGALAAGDVREYAVADGLRSVTGIRRDRSVVADRLGRIWFSTDLGISVVDPRQLSGNSVPAFTHVEGISADDSAIDLRGPVRLPAGTRRITFTYSGGSLGDATRVRYRYKLAGYDPDWSAPTAARDASYTNIGPGSYRFRVSASNNGGVWNEGGAFVDFDVAPAYYQTAWFRASFLAALLALMAGLYRLRLRYLKHQFRIRLDARVNERTRLARDLHDTLLQSFQGVLLKLQALTYLFPDRLSEAETNLRTVIEDARNAITEGREAVYGLRSSTVITNDLARAISALGEGLAADEKSRPCPEFLLRVEGQSRDLLPLIREETYRIASEAVRNAFRHAQAGRIEVEIHYERHLLRVRVRDNGMGIDRKILSAGGRDGHHGLPGMHERAQLAGGKLAVSSERDSGTEVELTIPASIAFMKSSPAREAAASGGETG